MIVYSTVYSGADQSKHQSSASLAFVWGIHRGPKNSLPKWPVTRKMFPFDDVIMNMYGCKWQEKLSINPVVPVKSTPSKMEIIKACVINKRKLILLKCQVAPLNHLHSCQASVLLTYITPRLGHGWVVISIVFLLHIIILAYPKGPVTQRFTA